LSIYLGDHFIESAQWRVIVAHDVWQKSIPCLGLVGCGVSQNVADACRSALQGMATRLYCTEPRYMYVVEVWTSAAAIEVVAKECSRSMDRGFDRDSLALPKRVTLS